MRAELDAIERIADLVAAEAAITPEIHGVPASYIEGHAIDVEVAAKESQRVLAHGG